MADGKLRVMVGTEAGWNGLVAQLDRIEKKLDALLEDSGVAVEVPTCGACGSDDVLEDNAFGEPLRNFCRACGHLTVVEQEAARG